MTMTCLRNMARLGAFVLLAGSSTVAALTIEYCSDANTASSSTLNTSIYQSNGLCQTQCNSDYAYAVLQGDSCWCSDYAPASQTDVSDCSSTCPGYPSDLCGNSDEGLYAYIAMSNVQPSGTATGTSDTSSTATSSTSSSTSTSSEGTATETSTRGVETVTVTASNPASTTFATSVFSSHTSSSSSSSSSTTTSDPSSITSAIISVQTVAGQPVTITVSDATVSTTSSASPSASIQAKSSSLSGGAIAGIVIGTLVGVGAVVALALWYFCIGRRRTDERSEKSASPNGGNDGSVTGGTIDTRRQSRGSQMSFMRNFMGPVDQENPPTSPTDHLSPNQAFIDNRMKKDAVLYPNGDRLSAVSLRDDEDYSRPVLRLTNPD